MRFRPYIFSSEQTDHGKVAHEVRYYFRTDEILVASIFKGGDGARDVVKRPLARFLNECDDRARTAFEDMIFSLIRRSRFDDRITTMERRYAEDAPPSPSPSGEDRRPSLRDALAVRFRAFLPRLLPG